MERIKTSGTIGTGGTAELSPSAMATGSIIHAANATTTWYLYPGACTDRYNGTWSPSSTPQADSLNTYTSGTTGPYVIEDQSLKEILWQVSDNGTCSPGSTCPPALSGSRMLWCGKFDAGWVAKYGYPNFTYQILYIDTGTHSGNYNLTFTYQFSSEFGYDHVWLIGGGGGATDPIGNSRAMLDAVIAGNTYLVQWTGSIRSTSSGATGGSTLGGPLNIQDNPGSPTTVTGASFTIDASHRALYVVLKTDCFNSSEDGHWPEGHGLMLDNISTSDNGSIYTDQAPAGGVDGFGGNVILGTPGAPILSARTPPGIGTLWQLVAGSSLPTPDYCSPKSSISDLIFEGGHAGTFHTVPGQANSIRTCTFPLPAGIASVTALWSQYLDLPAYQGYVQFTEYRTWRPSTQWSAWRGTEVGRRVGSPQAWGLAGAQLAEAAGADSIQLRYSFRCVPELAADYNTCGDVSYGILYDDFRLEVVTGVQAPIFSIYPASVGQTTFVDGTIGGTGCSGGTVAAGQCWPGVRGSDVGAPVAIHDNFNSPLGDSIVLTIATGLRGNGMGINWHHGFDRSVGSGLTIAYTNPNFVPAYDKPRVIYRLFDPSTKTWSPFDSSELDANTVAISGTDTIVIDQRYRMNWPPRDKIGSSLPGGFTVTGKSLYSQLAFLPRGTRLQYYFKAVDINGGTSYQFSTDALAREVEDLPPLPGSAIVAPDIVEFDVLPRVYSTAGTAGTLVAGKTNTPLLNLDGSYTAWNYGVDPVTQVLRMMGVRADRYRMLQGTEMGGNAGGHEFAGTRVGRLANYFPNMDEYAIKDSLATWYRIVIESTHRRDSFGLIEDQDARLIQQWWEAATPGTDGGDRCLFLTGNDDVSALLAVGGVPHPNENALATSVFGVAAAANDWNGSASIRYPLIKDLFADPAAGPALGAGSYSYQVDGGCPGPDRFDAFTKVGSGEAQNSATYPTFASVTNVAAVSYMTERDMITDHDRNKSLSYGFSIQQVRQFTNLVDTRAQILYKFLASCRGPRSVADTASCWPCPTDANKYGNWAVLGGFQTGTYGPLYAIQNGNLAAAAVEEALVPSFRDALMQNRPNPFNPETVIPFSLAAPGRVTVRIFDVRGRLVRTVLDAVKPAGIHAARWNGLTETGARSATGVYFYRITYPDGNTSAKKMTILR